MTTQSCTGKFMNICVCMPTIGRVSMLEENLTYSLREYRYRRIDVVVYDSSRDDEVETLIAQFIQQGFANLFYKKTKVNQTLDGKIFDILRNDEALQKYRYIWLISDSIAVFPDALQLIIRHTADDYDLIRLPSVGYGNKSDCVFTDIDAWFHHASRNMAHMATTLMNTRLLRGDINWDELYAKYIRNDDITAANHGFFFTVGFYLERIARLKNFRGLMIGSGMCWWRESPLKSSVSYWQPYILNVWIKSYCDTILTLPDCYTDKETIIRKSDNLHCNRFGENALIALRIDGQLSLETFERYKRYWHLVSDVSLERICEIAAIPIDELKRKYGEHYGDIRRWQQNLMAIEDDLSATESIIVYGAGLYGTNTVNQLTDDGFNVICVAVTDTAGNPTAVNDIPVKNIAELVSFKDMATVIIATMPDTAAKIRQLLIQYGFSKIRSLF